MAHLFRNIILCFLLLFVLGIKAQNEHFNGKKTFINANTLAIKEENQIKSLYATYNKGDEKLAYHKAHELLKKAQLAKTISNANLLIAYYFNKQSALDSSLYYTKKVLERNVSASDSIKTRLASLSYNLLASIYRRKGLLSESKKYRIKGMELALKYNEQELYFNHKHGLALIYSQEGDYDRALLLFKECLTYKEDSEMIYGSYINIGDIYSELKNYELSNTYLKKAALLCNKEKNNNCSAIIAISMGANYTNQNQPENALKSYHTALKIADTGNYQQTSLKAKIAIAQIHYNQKQFENARLLFNAALSNAIELGLLQEQITIYESLKNIAIDRNDYKEAYFFASKNEKLKDSINQIQNKRDINELEIKFNTLQNEKEIKILLSENKAKILELKNKEEALALLNLQKEINQKENENKILNLNNFSQKKASEIVSLKKDQLLKTAEIKWQKETKKITLIAFLILLLPIIALLVLYYQKLKTQRLLTKNEKDISEQKIISLVKDQELKLIKAAVKGQDKARSKIAKELHDSIGGNLAAIKLQLNTISTKPEAVQIIQQQLDETYKQVRDLSHNLIPKKFSENNFCNLLEDYQKNLAGINNLKTSFVAYPRNEIDLIDESLQMEIYKIIQELVTNTLKHAKATKIDLQLNCIHHKINILFEDNGIGFNPQKNVYGIGFKNINSRLKTIYGSMKIDSMLRRGTIINIEIPLNTSPFNT